MAGPHCAACGAYETRVMARADGEVLPPDVLPCKDFAMSDAFRDWAVGEMRKEVMAQVKGAGLDRMALVKAKDKQANDKQAQGERQRADGKGAGPRG